MHATHLALPRTPHTLQHLATTLRRKVRVVLAPRSAETLHDLDEVNHPEHFDAFHALALASKAPTEDQR